jgi:hypothetical protein
VQLAAGVVQAEHVTLGRCTDCHGATLIEGSRRLYVNCGHCRPTKPAVHSEPTGVR